MERCSVGECEDAVPVGPYEPVEEAVDRALAVPLGERPAAGGGFLGELREELVDRDVMVELGGVGERERGRVAPLQFPACDAVLRGDDVRAGLVENPVVGGASGAVRRWWPEAVEDA